MSGPPTVPIFSERLKARSHPGETYLHRSSGEDGTGFKTPEKTVKNCLRVYSAQ